MSELRQLEEKLASYEHKVSVFETAFNTDRNSLKIKFDNEIALLKKDLNESIAPLSKDMKELSSAIKILKDKEKYNSLYNEYVNGYFYVERFNHSNGSYIQLCWNPPTLSSSRHCEVYVSKNNKTNSLTKTNKNYYNSPRSTYSSIEALVIENYDVTKPMVDLFIDTLNKNKTYLRTVFLKNINDAISKHNLFVYYSTYVYIVDRTTNNVIKDCSFKKLESVLQSIISE